MISIFLSGLLTGLSLIIAIGSQNTFVFRQGLLKQHVLSLCLFCSLSDALLIFFGVFGIGILMNNFPKLPIYLTILGSIFLTVYGFSRFLAAYKNKYKVLNSNNAGDLKKILYIGAALTWLNPHVYLDTFGLIGTISIQYNSFNDKLYFALGATTASFMFFFLLGYCAQALSPFFTSNKAWQVLDILIGLVMLLIAISLVRSFLLF